MHPGSRILSYILAALVIPGLSFFPLALLMGMALLGIAWLRRNPLRLVWRTRWLLLVLVLGYGFTLPGDAILGFLGEWSPTRAGLEAGVVRAVHLMVLLLWLDVLVLSLSSQQLLSGIHALMSPLVHLGVDTGRVALRMALTLKAIERLEHGDGQGRAPGLRKGRGNLRHLFDPVAGDQMPEQVRLARYPLHGWDVLVPVLLLAGFGLLLWTGAWK